jgi:hypothetical protein
MMRQARALAKPVPPWALFLTAQTDIGVLAAAGARTRKIMAALEGEPDAAR